jgi:HAE1 family hydrophobic/amphiphilic exporter-1
MGGVAVTTVFFHLSRNIDAAMQDVQNAVAAAASKLPNDIDPPIISKVNFNKFPVVWLSVHGHRPIAEINRFVDDHLKQQIETIPGCGGVMYGGLRSRNMRVWLDNDKLLAHALDPLDVSRALRAQHVEMPAGYLQSVHREMNVRVMGEARTPREFEQIPLVNRNGQLIKIGDVAEVEDGLTDYRVFARFNREPNVGVGVMRATGANVVEVCDEVKRRIPVLRQMLPADMHLDISTDYSQFIKEDIAEVNNALFYGIILTAVVTFLFLGSLGTTLNVCISIPTSLLGTFVAMKWFNFGINFMTLLALSLSVGVVVDDAILVLENIYRRREHGEARKAAAVRGAREISFAAIAATFSIAAIFIPVAFMKGAIGRFFYQFGITCTVAVMLSLAVALTITPMLCSVFLSVRQLGRPCPARYRGLLGPVLMGVSRAYWFIDRWLLEPVLVRPFNWLMEWMTRRYAVVLRYTLRHKWFVVPISGLLAASALLFLFGLNLPLPAWTGRKALVIKPVGRELVPSEDQSRFVVNVICPVGCSIDYIDDMLARGEKVLVDLRDPVTGGEVIAGMFAAVSIRPGQLLSEGILFVRLVPVGERTWTQNQILAEVRKRLAVIPGMRGVALDLSTQGFTPTRGYPVNFAVQGPDWDKVTQLSEAIRERLIDARNDEGLALLTDVNSDYRPGMPEVRVVPDRVKAAELGIPIQRLAFTLNVAVGGVRSGRFTELDKRYDVRIRSREQQRSTPDKLRDIYIKTEAGKLVPLSDLAETKVVSTLPLINRYNHLRKVELTANMAPGVSQGEAIIQAHEIAHQVREEMGLPESYRIVIMGNAQAMKETLDSLWAALALGFVVAAMILGVQFNSFVHPFTVLMAVPFGVTGALGTLWLTGDTLNLMSMIGMVLLAGLVKKNSIILVDYTNQLRQHGMGLEEAVLTACPIRLRPILMTSLATMAAALPLALGYGAGAETRAPLARSIIGGILLSTLVTLIIVPILYVLFDRFGSHVQRLARRGPAGDGGAEGKGHQPETNGVVQSGDAPAPGVSGQMSPVPEPHPARVATVNVAPLPEPLP